MSTEDISCRVGKQGEHMIHPQHVEHIVRHAVRNISGAKKICDEVFNKKKEFTRRLPDDYKPHINGLKHFWN